jgi:membrane protease YdiL (CAAX protease family)
MSWDIWVILVALAVFLPWRGWRRMQRLLAMPQVGTRQRVTLYVSTIAFQWTIVAIVAWRARAHGFTRQELGLVWPHKLPTGLIALAGAIVIGTLHWLNLRRAARTQSPGRAMLQSIAERIFPRNRIERLPYFALALTAGLCEEFLYRGFIMASLRRAGLTAWLVILVSAILFGVAHLYQGRAGIIGTLVIGIVFGSFRIAYDSLVPVMAWHASIDAVAGVAVPKYLLRSDARTLDHSAD